MCKIVYNGIKVFQDGKEWAAQTTFWPKKMRNLSVRITRHAATREEVEREIMNTISKNATTVELKK